MFCPFLGAQWVCCFIDFSSSLDPGQCCLLIPKTSINDAFFKFMHSLGMKPMTLLLQAPCSTVWAAGLCQSGILCALGLTETGQFDVLYSAQHWYQVSGKKCSVDLLYISINGLFIHMCLFGCANLYFHGFLLVKKHLTDQPYRLSWTLPIFKFRYLSIELNAVRSLCKWIQRSVLRSELCLIPRGLQWYGL